jgi:hypothetical protein
MHANSGNGSSPLLALRNFLCSIIPSLDGIFLMTRIFHRVFKLCSCPMAKAATLQQVMWSTLSWGLICRRNSHALEFHAQLVAGSNASAGTMAPRKMACILMAMNGRMLLHTEQECFHTWDNSGIEYWPQNVFPVKGGRFWLILVTHDESASKRPTGLPAPAKPLHFQRVLGNQLWCLIF